MARIASAGGPTKAIPAGEAFTSSANDAFSDRKP
jgi:hypothetical protein